MFVLLSKNDYAVLKALSKHYVNPPFTSIGIDVIMSDLNTSNKEAVKKSMIALKNLGYIKAIIDQDDLGKEKLYVCTAITPKGFDCLNSN